MTEGPDFLIVGAAKSGTTILHRWLELQDGVFLPAVKEPHFFCFEGLDPASIGKKVDTSYAEQMSFSREDYLGLFKAARPDQIRGEASPGYLYYHDTADAIFNFNPDMKIICLLRNPVERAYSQYMHHIRDGYEHIPSLVAAIEAERGRISAGYWWGYHYRSGGFYADGARKYIEVFGRENVLVQLYDDLVVDPARVFAAVISFLGIASDQTPDFAKRENAASGLPKVPRFPLQAKFAHNHPRFAKLMAQLGLNPNGAICGKPAPALGIETKTELGNHYRQDILETSQIIGRDLSAWLQ